MIRVSAIIVNQMQKLEVAKDKAAFRNFGHAAASLRKDASASIEKSDEPSAPGSPPHTAGKGGKNIKAAIRYAYDKESAAIGPLGSLMDDAGARLEFGEEFEPRPFMGPALERAAPRLGDTWAGTIGG